MWIKQLISAPFLNLLDGHLVGVDSHVNFVEVRPGSNFDTLHISVNFRRSRTFLDTFWEVVVGAFVDLKFYFFMDLRLVGIFKVHIYCLVGANDALAGPLFKKHCFVTLQHSFFFQIFTNLTFEIL